MRSNGEMNEILGSRVCRLRKEQGITREALAEKLGVSARFLADVETGKAGVSLSTLKNLCKELGVAADFLLGIADYTEDEVRYRECEHRLRQIDPGYLKNLNAVLTAFAEVVRKSKK